MSDIITAALGLVVSALCLSASFWQLYIDNNVRAFAFAVLSIAVAVPVMNIVLEKIRSP
jgi:hypothetical protein